MSQFQTIQGICITADLQCLLCGTDAYRAWLHDAASPAASYFWSVPYVNGAQMLTTPYLHFSEETYMRMSKMWSVAIFRFSCQNSVRFGERLTFKQTNLWFCSRYCTPQSASKCTDKQTYGEKDRQKKQRIVSASVDGIPVHAELNYQMFAEVVSASGTNWTLTMNAPLNFSDDDSVRITLITGITVQWFPVCIEKTAALTFEIIVLSCAEDCHVVPWEAYT